MMGVQEVRVKVAQGERLTAGEVEIAKIASIHVPDELLPGAPGDVEARDDAQLDKPGEFNGEQPPPSPYPHLMSMIGEQRDDDALPLADRVQKLERWARALQRELVKATNAQLPSLDDVR